MKKSYSIFEAKARFSEILRIVKNKHDVIITDRSKPVVRIVPYEQTITENLGQRLQELEKLGLVSKGATSTFKAKQNPLSQNVLKKFLEDRE